MRVCRERTQVITIELGLPEAEWLIDQIRDVACQVPGALFHGGILEQVQRRLEYHVAEAKKGNGQYRIG